MLFYSDNGTTSISYPCECTAEGDPLLISFDYVAKLIVEAQKTIYSRGQNPGRKDKCKYQSRVVTYDNYPDKEGQVYIDWGSFSFGVHPDNPKKYERAVQIYQDKVILRGWQIGFVQPELTDADLPWEYETQQGVKVILSKVDNVLTITSPDCPWKYQFTRGGFNSKVYLGVGARFKPENNGGKEMGGICGDCDGIPEYNTCKNCGGEAEAKTVKTCSRKDVSDEENKYILISDSCKDGKHQG